MESIFVSKYIKVFMIVARNLILNFLGEFSETVVVCHWYISSLWGDHGTSPLQCFL